MKRLLLIGLACMFVQVSAYAQIRPLGRGTHAHPVNFRQTVATNCNGTLYFEYKWDSSTGNPNDLDRVWVGEFVTFDDGGMHVHPPWTGANDPNPKITPANRAPNGTACHSYDTHSSPMPIKGPANTYIATQYYGYHCYRCNQGSGSQATQAWQVTLMGPHTITRRVFADNGAWKFSIEKLGNIATVVIP